MQGYLTHHGIKGQKWGIRRYQNPDGSLTDAGYLHYYGYSKKSPSFKEKTINTIEKTPAGFALVNANRYVKMGTVKNWQIDRNIKTGRYANYRRHGNEYVVKEISDWTRDPVNKDYQLKKGQNIYRLTRDKDEKAADKEFMFATTNDDDRYLYRALFVNALHNNGESKQYEKTMHLDKDINVASKETQIDAIMKVTGVNKQTATLMLGRVNYETVLDELKRSKENVEFINELKARGYDAMIDLNDSGWMGREPVLLMDPGKYLKDDDIKELSKRDKWKSLDNVSYNYNKHIAGKNYYKKEK